MAKTFWLDDQTWTAIEPLLPRNQPGARRVDDRRVISGIIHVLTSGCRWRDCPTTYGPPTTIYNRYNRWSQRGIWTRIFTALVSAAGKPDQLLIDSSHVKAHRSAAGGKGGLLLKQLAGRVAGARPRSTHSATHRGAPVLFCSHQGTSPTSPLRHSFSRLFPRPLY
jgi:transposase